MRELKKRRELHKLEWEELLQVPYSLFSLLSISSLSLSLFNMDFLQEAESDDEKKHVYPVIWKFCDLDVKPHDKVINRSIIAY